MSAEFAKCPHPRDSWEPETGIYSYRCPECKGRPCLDCRRHGFTGFMIPLVSWMTARCEECLRTIETRQSTRQSYWRDRDSRLGKARIWDEARAADPDAPNPYAEPSASETYTLEQNPWLVEEGSS